MYSFTSQKVGESLGRWPCWLKLSATSSWLIFQNKKKKNNKLIEIQEDLLWEEIVGANLDKSLQCVIVFGCGGKTEHKRSTLTQITSEKKRKQGDILEDVSTNYVKNRGGSVSANHDLHENNFFSVLLSWGQGCSRSGGFVVVVSGGGAGVHDAARSTFLPCRRGRWGLSCVFHKATAGRPADLGRTLESPPSRSLRWAPDTTTRGWVRICATYFHINNTEKKTTFILNTFSVSWQSTSPVSKLLWLLLARPKLRLRWLALRDWEKDEVESMVFLRPPSTLVGYRNWV